MATEVYLVVVSKDSVAEPVDIRSVPRPDEVINFAYNLSKDGKDPRRIDNIMKVDIKGNVTFYEIIFNGRLELREIPMEAATLMDMATGRSVTHRYPADRSKHVIIQQDGRG